MFQIVRMTALWAGAGLLIVGNFGCGPDDTSCDAAKGRFTVNYQYVDGTCMLGGQDIIDLNICTTGNSQRSTGGNGYSIETEISATGCTINVEQTRYMGTAIDWRVMGDLDVDNADMLHGRIFRQHFTEGRACEGNYDVILQKVEDNPPECMSGF